MTCERCSVDALSEVRADAPFAPVSGESSLAAALVPSFKVNYPSENISKFEEKVLIGLFSVSFLQSVKKKPSLHQKVLSRSSKVPHPYSFEDDLGMQVPHPDVSSVQPQSLHI